MSLGKCDNAEKAEVCPLQSTKTSGRKVVPRRMPDCVLSGHQASHLLNPSCNQSTITKTQTSLRGPPGRARHHLRFCVRAFPSFHAVLVRQMASSRLPRLRQCHVRWADNSCDVGLLRILTTILASGSLPHRELPKDQTPRSVDFVAITCAPTSDPCAISGKLAQAKRSKHLWRQADTHQTVQSSQT